MTRLIPILAFIVFLVSSCKKDNSTITTTAASSPQAGRSSIVFTSFDTSASSPSKTILVDASRDGGVWWFPQNGTYSGSGQHQGKALADYLRSQGYKIHEVPRGVVITADLLKPYSNIIRVGGMGNYTSAELSTYRTWLEGQVSLLLMQDHLTNFPNDQFCSSLGLPFEGAITGTINSFTSHPITAAVNSIPFIAGSVIKNPDPARMTILGKVSYTNGNQTVTTAAMGILHHNTARIFFIGDINGTEGIPQPFTSNLVKWLFR